MGCGDAVACLVVGLVPDLGDLGTDLRLEALGLLATRGRARDGFGELRIGVGEEEIAALAEPGSSSRIGTP